jgi:hypothetical protein
MPSRAGWVTDLLSLPEDLSPPEEAEGRRAVTVVLVDRAFWDLGWVCLNRNVSRMIVSSTCTQSANNNTHSRHMSILHQYMQ